MREVKSKWTVVMRSLGRKVRLWAKIFEPIVVDGLIVGFLVSVGVAGLFYGGTLSLQYGELPIFLAMITAGPAFLCYVGLFAFAYFLNALFGYVLRRIWQFAGGNFEKSRMYFACTTAFKEANEFLSSISTTVCLVILFFLLFIWEKIVTLPHAAVYALLFWLGGNILVHAIFWLLVFIGVFFMEITKITKRG